MGRIMETVTKEEFERETEGYERMQSLSVSGVLTQQEFYKHGDKIGVIYFLGTDKEYKVLRSVEK